MFHVNYTKCLEEPKEANRYDYKSDIWTQNEKLQTIDK